MRAAFCRALSIIPGVRSTPMARPVSSICRAASSVSNPDQHPRSRTVLAGHRLAHRERVAQVVGEILEIGFSTRLNLPHYPEPVRTITTTRRSRPWPRVTERDRPPARWRRADQDVGPPRPDPGQLGSRWDQLDRQPNLSFRH